MTHQRPIPTAGQTPYPRVFQPHDIHIDDADETGADTAHEQGDDAIKGSWAGISGKAAIGAAAGIGSAALLAALLYARRRE